MKHLKVDRYSVVIVLVAAGVIEFSVYFGGVKRHVEPHRSIYLSVPLYLPSVLGCQGGWVKGVWKHA